jgi:hypothetical protein
MIEKDCQKFSIVEDGFEHHSHAVELSTKLLTDLSHVILKVNAELYILQQSEFCVFISVFAGTEASVSWGYNAEF